MNRVDCFDAARTGIDNPNHAVRNYDLSRMTALVGLLENPWYPPYVQDAPHTHNCMEIGLCVSGHGVITIGDVSRPFSEGTLAVAPKDVPHAQQNMGERETRWLYVLVNTQVLLMETPQPRHAEAQAMLGRIPGGVYLGPNAAAGEIRATIQELFRVYRERGGLEGMETELLTHLLMVRLCRVPDDAMISPASVNPAHTAVEPALQLISENYAQDIRVCEMAAVCALSESYFRKLFGDTMGMSPVEYLNRYRVNRSIYLLYTTNETVLTIAGLSGFASIASYNRNFMKYVGVSPAQWRKNVRRL